MKILVPTDFSEHAEYALRVAADIARKKQARIYLLHIVHIPSYDEWNLQDHQNVAEGIFILKLVKKRFKEWLAKPYLKDVNVVQVLQFENVYDTIAEQAREHDIDLIVMGSHGTSGWREFFDGSNTERVVRTVSCPVLTVKREHQEFNPQKVVFASNFLGESLKPFEKLRAVVDNFSPDLYLLKVVTPQQFETTAHANQLMADFIEQTGANATTYVVNAETVEAGIQYFCDEIGAELIAMETHGRQGISRVLHGSITESVVNHLKRPVLSVRIEEE